LLRSRLIKTDPCDGIMIEDTGHAKDKRTAYDSISLAAVFEGNVYSADARPTAGKGEAAYWLPLLSLYTGARLNELGQLRPKDIVQELYLDADEQEVSAWVIRIVEDKADGLRLKTANSERRVPIHPALIELGFLRFVQASTKRDSKRLFPDLKADKYGNVTAQWSKWYGRYLRAICNVTDKRITFHSFRHSFKHFARYSGLAPDVQNEITGHETGDIGDRYGGLNYPLRPLVEGINRYRVPAFTMPASPPEFRDVIPQLSA
jgi:integrase